MTPEVKSLYRLDTEMKFTTEVIHLTEENTDPRLSTMIMAKETTKVPSAAMNWLSVRLEMNRPMAVRCRLSSLSRRMVSTGSTSSSTMVNRPPNTPLKSALPAYMLDAKK